MIDREEVRRVAHLARLELQPSEEEKFTKELSAILDYFEQLKELDTEKVAPTMRAINISNVTRPDQLEPYQNRDALLAAAPEPDGDFFRVPQILSDEN